MSDNKDSKANVLVLGGCGFIGRNFVKYLVDQKHEGLIRIADKSMPATSYLNADHKAAFEAKNVEFKQADLSRDDHVAKVFTLAEGKFDYVINLCGETRCGLSEADYKKKTFETAVKASAGATTHGVKKWVEVSSAQIYDAHTPKPMKEDGKTEPWTLAAKHRLMAEEAVRKNSGLPVVVLRPAIVYGPGDLTGLTPRICCAAVYKKRNEKMKFLWDKGLKMNTVNVRDVAAAIWVAATEIQAGATFNLADQTDLTQGQLNGWLGEIFDVKVGFLGTAVSSVAKLNLKSVAADANDKHVPGFTKLCQDSKILNTPVSAYIDPELLLANNTAVDGTKIAASSSFRYQFPQITKELLRAQLDGFIQQELFPPLSACAHS